MEKVSMEEWQNLYERLIDADLREGTYRMLSFDELTETNAYKLSRNNVIPIGIMNLSSIYLTGSEIEQHEAAKKAGQSRRFEDSARFNIVYGAVLQEEVFQGNIAFQVSRELYISNDTTQSAQVELDLEDGRGFVAYPFSEKPIAHQFSTVGKHTVHIRLTLGRKAYLFDTEVNVRQLERSKPFAEFQVEAPRIYKAATSDDRAARTMLAGGNVRIILGCDQILNKPIIIAEGFD
ncbi:hypothetical protein, partial [Dyadobacter sp.]|uniref:hypothetical protein n=1 Tax=Dyadobacter sp. TaxID=1914288 RepID=UPI003F712C9C